MEGIITKILSDKCYVKTNQEVVLCFLRGRMRRDGLLPFVGDRVIINQEEKIIEKILPRENEIRRPSVSNITQGIIVASLKKPDLDTNLIDKILVELEYNRIKPILCFTKKDLLTQEEIQSFEYMINYYRSLYPVYFNDELEELKKIFKNEISVFIGQTGAGKSTLLNKLNPKLALETNEISDALDRGKHTTRHVEMHEMLEGMLLDSPGFSALEFPNMLKKEIRDAFIEFQNYPCPYRDCMHVKEDNCQVKLAVIEGAIPKFRYNDYLILLKTAQDNNEEYKRR